MLIVHQAGEFYVENLLRKQKVGRQAVISPDLPLGASEHPL